MADMKNLVRLMRDLEDQLATCMRCGMCQSVCPLFAETGREADVARGKLALLDGLMRESLKNPHAVSERLDRCILCGSCAANCPSGVKVLDIFLKARAILSSYMGLSPVKRVVFREVLARPELFDGLLQWAEKVQTYFTKPVDDLLGTSCARFTSPLGDRHFQRIASVPFRVAVTGLNTEPGASGLKVAFFAGCLVDKIFPHVGSASLHALQHHGVGVFIPEGMGCCGIPALSGGDATTFTRLVQHNVGLLSASSFDYLITPCATCTSTIKKVWPMMAGGLMPDSLHAVRSIAEKTMDISQFIADLLEASGTPAASNNDEKIMVTYHDPCHLKKSLGVASQPRSLIKANSKYQLKEMAEADRCCGCGGSFNIKHYDISSAIGKRKRDNIVRSECSVVATGCPACMLQISDLLSQSGDRIRVKHSIEIYAESLE